MCHTPSTLSRTSVMKLLICLSAAGGISAGVKWRRPMSLFSMSAQCTTYTAAHSHASAAQHAQRAQNLSLSDEALTPALGVASLYMSVLFCKHFDSQDTKLKRCHLSRVRRATGAAQQVEPVKPLWSACITSAGSSSTMQSSQVCSHGWLYSKYFSWMTPAQTALADCKEASCSCREASITSTASS